MGHDKKNASIEIKVRPFVRYFGTRAYRDWQASQNPSSSDDGATRNPQPQRRLPKTSTGRIVCKQQAGGGRTSLMRDIVSNSRFVHAQIWSFDNADGELRYAGEHYTKPSFIQWNPHLGKDLDTLDESNQQAAGQE